MVGGAAEPKVRGGYTCIHMYTHADTHTHTRTQVVEVLLTDKSATFTVDVAGDDWWDVPINIFRG